MRYREGKRRERDQEPRRSTAVRGRSTPIPILSPKQVGRHSTPARQARCDGPLIGYTDDGADCLERALTKTTFVIEGKAHRVALAIRKSWIAGLGYRK